MDDLKEITARFYKEAFANRDLSILDEMMAEDFVEHEEPPPGVDLKPGRQGAKQFLGMFLEAFDPLTVEPLETYRDGNTVIVHALFSGTHSGDFAGIPATGKPFSIRGIDIIRFDNGKAVEHWGQTDNIGLLTQIGAIPPME